MCDVCGCAAVSGASAGDEPRAPDGDRRQTERPAGHAHGAGEPAVVALELGASLLARNDRQAGHLRQHFEAAGVLALNVMGSPGSGKTALLEATARALGGRLRLAAVSGDLATDLDAERLGRAGIVSAAITTGSACHLDAAMVHDALHEPRLAAALREADVFFVENVGNLVCPAVYDVGQTANVVVLSVTEGVDKPLKYPVMFRKADLVLVTKVDLLPHLPGTSLDAIRENVARVMPAPRVLALSAASGEGVAPFIGWIEARLRPQARRKLQPDP
jgi:hydrogenase nickel incorporation protein HypB